MPYNFATLACFVGRLLDELDYDRFDALGISWGGGLAQQLALQHPRRCRRLVLVSTGTGMLMVPARLSVLSTMLTPRRYRDPTYAKAIAPELYGGRMRRRPDEVRQVVYEHERLRPKAGYFSNSSPGSACRASPPCPSSGSPPSSSPGTTPPSSRW
jgi:pimeloyl-ACP methyl ester carboxylesterase